MKIRKAFVSNSSTSSFVACGNEDEDFMIELDLRDYGYVCKTVEQLVRCCVEQFYIRNDEQLDKLLKGDHEQGKEFLKWKELIEEGNTLIIGGISHDEQAILDKFPAQIISYEY